MDQAIKHYVLIKNKKYEYSLELKKGGVTNVICDGARMNQEFQNEDIPSLLRDLPEIILMVQEDLQKSDQIRLRISPKEKIKIEKIALKKGYTSISKFLRDLALGNVA